MGIRSRAGRGAVVLGCVAAVAAVVPGGFGGLLGLAGAQATNNTVTTSFSSSTTTERVDLEDAPPPECEFPGSPSTQVDETSTVLEPVITLEDTIGPNTIIIGDRNAGGTPFEVLAGTRNINVNTHTETLITQFFQATAAGEACAVVAAARFTA